MCHWFTPILIIGIVLFVLVIVLLFQYCNVQRKADLSSITDAIQTSPPYQSKGIQYVQLYSINLLNIPNGNLCGLRVRY